jgi:outer membrane protein assembly factor BamA
MTGTAFPSFMDAPNITGWSPFGTAYDLGTGGPQAYTSPLSGTVGFTGADAVRTSKGLTAATVGFTGSLTKRLARSLAATVSFTGAHATAAVHNFTQALTATLSFTGAQSRRVGKGLAATVSFTGAQSKRDRRKQVRDGVVHRGADAAG